eukprot:m.5647 g.5647  ORF g.5647 m.5647 type:complete len:111 (+) comp4013_c0_seq1:120-452(+)
MNTLTQAGRGTEHAHTTARPVTWHRKQQMKRKGREGTRERAQGTNTERFVISNFHTFKHPHTPPRYPFPVSRMSGNEIHSSQLQCACACAGQHTDGTPTPDHRIDLIDCL